MTFASVLKRLAHLNASGQLTTSVTHNVPVLVDYIPNAGASVTHPDDRSLFSLSPLS